MAQVILDGIPTHTVGELPPVGSAAPDFRLTGTDLKDVSLASFRGKRKIVSAVPSLATAVCAASARAFNARAAGLADTVVLVVSADLPFAMKGFCAAQGLDNVVPLSMMRGRGFAKDYGTLIVDGPFEGLSARAVVVIDEGDRVVHTELVPDIGREPDYDAALRAAAPRS